MTIRDFIKNKKQGGIFRGQLTRTSKTGQLTGTSKTGQLTGTSKTGQLTGT